MSVSKMAHKPKVVKTPGSYHSGPSTSKGKEKHVSDSEGEKTPDEYGSDGEAVSGQAATSTPAAKRTSSKEIDVAESSPKTPELRG